MHHRVDRDLCRLADRVGIDSAADCRERDAAHSVLPGKLQAVAVTGSEQFRLAVIATAVGLAIVIAAFYLVGLGVGSFVASAWAWLGLRGGVEDTPRKWHIAQIVIALPGIAIGVIVFSWLVGQGQVG